MLLFLARLISFSIAFVHTCLAFIESHWTCEVLSALAFNLVVCGTVDNVARFSAVCHSLLLRAQVFIRVIHTVISLHSKTIRHIMFGILVKVNHRNIFVVDDADNPVGTNSAWLKSQWVNRLCQLSTGFLNVGIR